ncbi:MAG TPA: hypothetical protein VNN80_05140 [Polyangiaceae bacterium]|nr:hypothetical protein [Polyangiaceae bacterium]
MRIPRVNRIGGSSPGGVERIASVAEVAETPAPWRGPTPELSLPQPGQRDEPAGTL